MTNQLITHRLLIDNSLISRMLLMSSISYVLVVNLSSHFTVTGENETGVDLVLIQPFLLYYVNHIFLMLTSIFKQNFH